MLEMINRRTDRVLINMPVTVSGTDASGKPFSEDTVTITVSQHGAAIVLRTVIAPGKDISLHRQRTRSPRVAKCTVKEQSGNQAGQPIFSVAFREPASGFWDIYFPPLPSHKTTAGRALLVCEVCGARKVVHLDSAELSDYNANRKLSLACASCRRKTMWLESREDLTKTAPPKPANPGRMETAPSLRTHNQRKHRRVPVEIPVCIRQSGSEDDLVTTADISHGGLLLISRREYRAGTYIQVAVPYSADAANIFVDARVVHTSGVPSQNLYRIGITYLAENQPASSSENEREMPCDPRTASSAA